QEQRSYDLVFVDGDHDFESVAFDLQRASSIVVPGGFVLLDDADQPGVREAALRFLADCPDWKVLGRLSAEMLRQSSIIEFYRAAMSVEGTALWCLRSPDFIPLTNRLVTFGNFPFAGDEVHGIEFKIKPDALPTRSGALHYKVYLRALPYSYSSGPVPLEYAVVGEAPIASLESGTDRTVLRFQNPMQQLRGLAHMSDYSKLVEIFLKYIPDSASPERLSIIDRPTALAMPRSE